MRILIASHLEPEHVEAIAASHPDVEVLYDPALVAVPQYVADHRGPTPELSAADQRRWEDMAKSGGPPAACTEPAVDPGHERRHRRVHAEHRARPQ
jgi:hypothetical protein